MSGIRNLILKMHLYESIYDASSSPVWKMLLHFLAIIFSEVKEPPISSGPVFPVQKLGLGV